jgi:hypothetical protein
MVYLKNHLSGEVISLAPFDSGFILAQKTGVAKHDGAGL